MSDSSVPGATRAKLEAYTDWLVVISITILVALDKVPWEWGLGIIAAIGGVHTGLKGMGKSGSAVGLLVAHPVAKLAGLLLGGASKHT